MPELKVGIVGCGRMGRERGRCAAALGAKVSLVFDTDPARAQSLCDEYCSTPAQHMEECLETDLDAIFVCIPPGSRGTFELHCMDRGVPLLSEKPAGISAVTVSLLSDRSLRTCTINAVGYMNRYRSSIQAVRRKLPTVNAIGFSAHWVCRPYGVPWWGVEELSGGPHNEQATHLFDMTRFLFGEISAVQSRAVGRTRVSSILQFRSGVVGNVFYSCDGNSKDIGIRIFTDRGILALTGWDFAMSENTVDSDLAGPRNEDIFLEETRAFLNAVQQHRQELILSNFFDAHFTQLAIDASRQSIHTGRTVEVNE